MEKKKALKKHMMFFICSGVLLIANLLIYSLGWFTFNKESSSNGMGMGTTDCPFELITRGDTFENAEDIASHSLLDKIGFSSLGNIINGNTKNQTGIYTVTVDGKDEKKIAYEMNWLLSDTSNMNNITTDDESEDYGLKPGSSGKIEFYIRPDEAKMPMNILCSISLTPHKIVKDVILKDKDGNIVLDENGNPQKTTEYPEITKGSESSDAIDYLRGHILFFRNIDDKGHYTDPIIINDDGEIRFEFEQPVNSEKIDNNKEVRVEIYWIWPRTLPELLLQSDDPNLMGRNQLLADIPSPQNESQESTEDDDDESEEGDEDEEGVESTEDKKTTKEKIVEIIKEKNDYFFCNNTISNINTLVENIAHNSGYDKSDYIKICSAYNGADQYIGINVSFVVLSLTCSLN